MSWHVGARARAGVCGAAEGRAQTCLASPPSRAPRHVFWVLGEAYRGTRLDGTCGCWKTLSSLMGEIIERGWEAHPITWGGLTRGYVQLDALDEGAPVLL